MPSAFVLLDALPADRRTGRSTAGRCPRRERAASGEAYEASAHPGRGDARADLGRRCSACRASGVHDNFFELGGDSILSIQIVARADRRAAAHAAAGLPAPDDRRAGAARRAAPRKDAEQGPGHGRGAADPDPAMVLRAGARGAAPLQPGVAARAAGEASTAESLERRGRALGASRRAAPAVRPSAAARACERRSRPSRRRVSSASISRASHRGRGERRPSRRRVGDAPGEPRPQPRARSGAWCCFDLGPGQPGRLLIVIHHLAVDGVSWRVLLEDLQAACEPARARRGAELAAEDDVVQALGRAAREHAESGDSQRELDYWRGGRGGPAHASPGRRIRRGSANTVARRTGRWPSARRRPGRCCRTCRAAYRTQISDVLLRRSSRRSRAGRGATTLLVDLEGHGREDLFEDVDLSRTVGWFTTMFPVRSEAGRAGRARPEGREGAAARRSPARHRLRAAALPAGEEPR